MEEIKLPKFKTKEELEQFAMGLITENESLKKVITLKDSTIKNLDKQLGDFLEERLKSPARLSKAQDLEAEIKSLKEKHSEDKYKELYSKDVKEHIATKIRCYSSEFELDKTNRKVHKLCSMVTYMFGLLPRFKAKRVTDMYGKFVVEDYRL
jgi:predicted metal-dependent hydrolase